VNTETHSARSQGRTLSLRSGVLLGLILVLAGAAALWLIFSTEPIAEREAAVRQTAMLVQVTKPERGSFKPMIEALGTVRPAREITLTPRVGGEVISISDAFDPGGFVREGEVLLRIDEADYRIALQQRESELQQAISELEMEKGAQAKAAQDYQQLGREVPEERRALILREPQLRSAEAVVKSAGAAAEQARLDLERTTIRAPFDAQVLSREINVGTQVTPGGALARLAGVKTYWVETTIPLDKLRRLAFTEDDTPGSLVHINHRIAWPKGQERLGRLYRLIGELEMDTRLARVLVAVEDPLALQSDSADIPKLMIGTFVECRIEGREIADALRLRREHVRANNTVWLMREGMLAIQPVEVVFEDAEFAYIGEGLEPDDRVVTTSLATVQEGVPLRTGEAGTE
jgi:RND family efflux transporter MFP subunit